MVTASASIRPSARAFGSTIQGPGCRFVALILGDIGLNIDILTLLMSPVKEHRPREDNAMSHCLALKKPPPPVSDKLATSDEVVSRHYWGTITRFACCSVSQAEMVVASL